MYAIANNGFIEGKQNEPLMQLMENFCRRAGLTWGGGVGIGGGVMLNVTRILYFVQVGMLVLNLLFNGISTGDFLPVGPLQSFLKNVLWLLYLNLGVLLNARERAYWNARSMMLFRLSDYATQPRDRRDFEKRMTRSDIARLEAVL